ncbi:MAG: methyltransferase domain-containing protein [Halanaerobiaceae bacterium]|nr:methyltransferase domain-containing protein [Halanaerobiaceae bacterium]
MTKFYTEIARYYDYIFPLSKAKIDLIKELAGEPPKELLDVACGSGLYSIELNEAGYIVTAIDLDKSMIQELKEKKKEINAQVLNMLDIDILQKKFDLIFCIGNSLVHLNDNEEILHFLKACKNSLEPGGKLLIQIVNNDRVLGRGVKNLPTIRNEEAGLIFERYYEYLPEENKIDFKTILKVEGRELENHVLLYPVRSEELLFLLKESGFDEFQTYGGFNKEKYEKLESFPLIVAAE